MLIEIHSLPCTERQPAVGYGQIKVAICQNTADMGGHVIAALGIMAKDGIAVPDETTEKGFEVCAHRRIGVFAQHQRSAGVLYEHMAQTCAHA